jgi:hypothetical protein
MANVVYDKARQSFLKADLDMEVLTIKAALVDAASYTPNTATDEFWSSAIAGLVGTPQTLGSKTYTAGVFDAAPVTFTAVPAGGAIEYIVIFSDTGNSATSQLVALITSATNLPVTPNGGNITVTWDTGANKIFKL